MNGVYDPSLVTLSLLVAIFASYTALDLARGVAVATGRDRLALLCAGALAMGVGIWSMHFVGMLAFRMPGAPISYDVPLMALSVGVAVLASGLALVVASRSAVTLHARAGAAMAMGGAIAGMHYIGIWSMRMPATITWNSGLVAASIGIAITASFAALTLALRYRFDQSTKGAWSRAGGAVVMGFAIAGMHYTAMLAAVFSPAPDAPAMPGTNVLATAALGITVAAATLVILAVAIASSAVTRELARRNTIARESAELYREAEGARQDADVARREALALAAALQDQAGRLQQQAAESEALNDELAAAEERLRGIVDSALDAVVAADANGVILEWNRNAETIFGWAAAEAVGKNLSDTIIPPHHRAAHRQGLARFLATGEARILNRRIEITAMRKGGGEFPIELAIAAIRSGPDVMFTSFIRDITDMKQAERQRREAEQREQQMLVTERERARLSALFEQAPAFIALLQGPDHVFELTNARYDQIIGHRELLGRPIREALPELVAQGYLALLDRVYATGEPYVGVGSRVLLQTVRGAEPEERYVNFVYQPFAAPDGTTSGIFVHGVDVSDIVRARNEAEQANSAKNDFLSRMSHELRTPLNAILGFGQLLQLEAVTAGNRESAEQIVRAGKHLLDLIDEVLDIARIEGGQLGLSVEPVSAPRILHECLELVRDMASKQGIDMRHDTPPHCRFVLADQQRLKQVLLNLLSNAIKYNRPGGTVTMSCETPNDGRVRVVVTDTGYGVPADQLGRLFTPFDRLGAEQRGVDGAGLGLALSLGLMEAMGGTIGVESVAGEGSRFWAELPAAPAAVDTTQPAAGLREPTPPPPDEAQHTVLLVEDNPANVRLMERIFQRRPRVKLLTAMQGSLGLDLAIEHRPGLVLLDVNLPDMSGNDVLLAMRKDPAARDIPVVMISGDAIPAHVQQSLELGARAYLTKPFDVHELLELVDGILEGAVS